MAPTSLFATLFLVLVTTPSEGKGFLVERKSSIRGHATGNGTSHLDRELDLALGEVLGCGEPVEDDHLLTIQKQLRTIWNTLPKNFQGNVERRSLRYLVHRHFSRQSALQIRGFEPARTSNASAWGSDDILAQRVPAFVEAFLESGHKAEHGFRLEDASRLVAVIERLIFDSEGSVLEMVYNEQHKPTDVPLGKQGVRQLLEGYMIRWMLGDDEEGIQVLSDNRQLLEATIPHWDEVIHFADGQVEALDFQRSSSPQLATEQGRARESHNALSSQYSFEDTHRMVGEVTHTFAHFWDSECRSMKAALVEMDSHHTGRVPLSKFYGHGLDSEWRFGESEEYLREMGALDESGWRKQVIIPNYIQASSNCIVGSQHYLVCCVNDCDAVLEEVELAVQAPSATAEQILAVVANISSVASSFDRTMAPLPKTLKSQLSQIAEAHGGEVPLHSRLFAQWMHYAFPRECPFPHKSGAVALMTPTEFGDRYIASEEDMKKHVDGANLTNDIDVNMNREDMHWMSQWSEEEELIVDYKLTAPWQRRFGGSTTAVVGVVLLVGLAAFALLGRHRNWRKTHDDSLFLPISGKSHMV